MRGTWVARSLWVVLLLVPFAATGFAGDDPPPDPTADPVLTPEQQAEHDAEVARQLAILRDEKNKEVVERQIQALGANGSRVARDALIEFSTDQKNHEYLTHAFAALAKIGGKTVVEHLCGRDGLRAKGFMKQLAAAKALGEAKERRAIGAVLELLNGRRTKIEVKAACCIALARMGPEDARCIDAVMRHSAHKKDTIRANAVEALGHLGSRDALERLLFVLEKDKNTRVRGAAAKGLGILGNPEAVPALRKAAAEDKSLTVKDEAMAALKELGATLR